jgi:hypothetical protein
MACDNDLEFVNSEQSEEHLIWYDWLANSGTTSHITNTRGVLSRYMPISRQISGIGSESIEAVGQGTVELINYIGKTKISFKLKDVLYVPKATHNLVSISCLDREGGGTHIQNGTTSGKTPGLYSTI